MGNVIIYITKHGREYIGEHTPTESTLFSSIGLQVHVTGPKEVYVACNIYGGSLVFHKVNTISSLFSKVGSFGPLLLWPHWNSTFKDQMCWTLIIEQL